MNLDRYQVKAAECQIRMSISSWLNKKAEKSSWADLLTSIFMLFFGAIKSVLSLKTFWVICSHRDNQFTFNSFVSLGVLLWWCPDAACLASKISDVWAPLNECECDCPALQGHSFTIGTELMKSVEEEVNFDGHFYTFSGFNVSIFATCLSTPDVNLDCSKQTADFVPLFSFLWGVSGQFSLHSTQWLELWVICASSTCCAKQP